MVDQDETQGAGIGPDEEAPPSGNVRSKPPAVVAEQGDGPPAVATGDAAEPAGVGEPHGGDRAGGARGPRGVVEGGRPRPLEEEVRPAEFQEFDQPIDKAVVPDAGPIGVLADVVLPVTVELGRVSAKIRELLQTGPGSIIELDRRTGDPVDVLAGGRLIARGEVVVVGQSMGVRITELVSSSR